MRKNATAVSLRHQGVEIRKPIQKGSIIVGLEAAFEIRIEGENL
jgi:hypothetical protein